MTARYLLAIDAGTSGVRCLITDSNGRVIAICRRGWNYQTPESAGSLGKEFIPDVFWKIICDTVREALRSASINIRDLAGVSTTSQREGMVFLDKKGGELYAGPNVDLRAVMEGMAIDSQYAQEVYAITGHLPSLLFAPAKLRWFYQNQPETYSRIATVLAISDWMTYRLCGELFSEVCAASEIGLLDIQNREWSKRLRELLALPDGIYPELVPAGSRVGKVTHQAAAETGLAEGTPVAQGAPDTHCGLIGMGIKEVGDVGIVLGWSAPVQMVTGKTVFDSEARIWTGCHIMENRWILESSTGEAGNAFNWLRETMFNQNGASREEAYDLMDCLALSVSPGADGVLAAIGPGVMDMSHLHLGFGGFLFPVPLSAGSIQRTHLVRAALENICFAIRANCSQLETISGLKMERVSIGGGLAKSRCLKQILPAVLGLPVCIADVTEVSGLGAAMCAAAGSGIYAGLDEAMSFMKTDMRVILPVSLEAAEYEEHYQRWVSAARWLRKIGEGIK